MRPHPLLVLALAVGALSSPAVAAGNVDDSCSIKNQVRVDLTRLDGGPPLLIRQDDLMRYYPDRARRMGIAGTTILTCDRTPEGLGCALRDETPSDLDFGAKSLLITRLFPRFLSTVVVRVDFIVLSPGSCFDPLFRAPT